MKPILASSRSVAAILLFASASFFVTGLPISAQTATGVTAPWEASVKIAELNAQAVRLKPLLEQLTPQDWVAKGAPQAYVVQWRDAKLELEYLTAAATILEKQPEKLTAALDTYFRLQSLEFRLDSLIEGVRKYHNPAVGDLILGVSRANSANRDGLRQYISDLAAQQEQERSVMEQEAQRCRQEVDRVPTSSRSATKAPVRSKSGK